MSRGSERLQPAIRFSQHAPNTWGPYWEAIFGWDPGTERLVTGFTQWKLSSTAVNVARGYWNRREYHRLTYESVYGSDPEHWPSRHPGIVLGDRPGCLRCHYLGARTAPPDALDLAWRHEASGGETRAEARRHVGTD